VAPVYERLASQLTEVGNMVFTKVDTDKQQQIARAHNITALVLEAASLQEKKTLMEFFRLPNIAFMSKANQRMI